MKVKFTYCEGLLVIVGVLMIFAVNFSAAAVAAASTMSTGSPKYNCSEPPRFENFDISKCCRLPAINLGAAVETCHKHIKSLKSHNANYPVYAHVCYPECIYRATGAFIDDDIHVETVKNFLQNNIEQRDKIILPTIVESFRTCMTNIKSTMLAKGIKSYPKIDGLGCSPYASMVYGCVNAETFLHCPQEMWQNESTCISARNFAQQCNPLPHVPMPMI